MTDAQADTLVALARRHPPMAPREVNLWDQTWYWDEGVVPTTTHPVLPPSLMPEPSGGWISPDGRMWRCHDARHEDTAAAILRELEVQRPGDPGTYLEDRGWIHVFDYGAVMSASGRLTQAQMDVLFDLAQAHPSMRHMLMQVLEIERRRSARE